MAEVSYAIDWALRSRVVEVIDDGNDMTLATLGRDGYPHATTVSYVSDGLSIWFGTSAESMKTRNLAADDRVSLTIDLPYTSWDDIRGIALKGRAHLVEDPDEQRAVGAMMLKKFPQIGSYMSPDCAPKDLALFRIDAETVSLLDYRMGFGHTEELRL